MSTKIEKEVASLKRMGTFGDFIPLKENTHSVSCNELDTFIHPPAHAVYRVYALAGAAPSPYTPLKNKNNIRTVKKKRPKKRARNKVRESLKGIKAVGVPEPIEWKFDAD